MTIVDSSLGFMTSPATGSGLDLEYQVWISYLVELKSN